MVPHADFGEYSFHALGWIGYSPAQPSPSPSPSVPAGTGCPPALIQSAADVWEAFPGTLRLDEGLGEGLAVADVEAECEAE
jgi:hypothetical protein